MEGRAYNQDNAPDTGSPPKRKWWTLELELIIFIVINLTIIFIGLFGAIIAIGYGMMVAVIDIIISVICVILGAWAILGIRGDLPSGSLASIFFAVFLLLLYLLGMIGDAMALASLPPSGFLVQAYREELTCSLIIDFGLFLFALVVLYVAIRYRAKEMGELAQGPLEERMDDSALSGTKMDSTRPTKRCYRCGAMVPDDALQCDKCGTRWG